MAVNQHMVGIEIPQIQSHYRNGNGYNGYHIIDTERTSLDYYKIDSRFLCYLSAGLTPNTNSSYNSIRVFIVENCSSFEDGLNYITNKKFVKFFTSLPYGFVIVLKCIESCLKNDTNVLIKLNSCYGTKKPLIVSFEADGVPPKIFYKNHGENCRFSEVLSVPFKPHVTNFGSLILNLEDSEFGYFSGIFEDITLNKYIEGTKGCQNSIEKLMDIFARNKDLLGIRFLHLFNPQLKPDFALTKGILDIDYNNTKDSDFDGFTAIFDYKIENTTNDSTVLDGHDCHLITNLTFKNQDNLLMLAVRKRNLVAVNFFINCGINVNLINLDHKLPADIAYELGFYDILLALLLANSMFPRLFTKPLNCPTDLAAFVDNSTQFHDLIKNIEEKCINDTINISQDDLDSIYNIKKKYPHLDYWYSMSNESAATRAICEKKFKTYDILLRAGLFVGPYEDITAIKKSLTESEQQKIRIVNAENAQKIPKDYLLVLRLNSYMWQSKSYQSKHATAIKDAFDILDSKPEIQPILEIVAAAKTFRIIFDFNHSHVETLDFTSRKSTSAVFHLQQSHIYIGAKDLLVNANKYNTIATLGHELTHFAMLLTYGNLCNPYEKTDFPRQQSFQKILEEYSEEKYKEYLIFLVYKYPQNRQHAELIVRAPHMMIHYINDEATFKSIRTIFDSLFGYYNLVIEDVKGKINNVNQGYYNNIKFEHEFWEKKRKRQKIIKYSLISAIFLTMIGFFLILLNSFEPCLNFDGIECKWDELRKSTQERFLKKYVKFNGNSVKLGELTRNHPEVLSFLTDAQIKNIEGIDINPQNLALPFRYHKRNFTGYSENYFYVGPGMCSNKYTVSYNLKDYESMIGQRKIYQIVGDPVAGATMTFIHTKIEKSKKTTDIFVDYLNIAQGNLTILPYTSLTNWSSTNITNFLIEIHNLGSSKILPNSIESEIFIKKFESGDVCLFIDHIDFIFLKNETFAEIFLHNLFKLSKNNSELWIASRNWFGERIEKIILSYDKKFGGRHKLLPLHCEDRDEFMTNSIEEKNLSSNDVELIKNKLTEVFDLTDKWRNWRKTYVDNICLLRIIVDHTIESIFSNKADINFYDILRQYMIRIRAHKEGREEIYETAADSVLATVALKYVHMNYISSIKRVNISQLIYEQMRAISHRTSRNFTVHGQTEDSWDFSSKEILEELRRGVLKVDNNQISFLHLINFEYFLANYIRNDMWSVWSPGSKSFEQKLLLLFNIFKDPKNQFPIVQRCIIDAIQADQKSQIHRTTYDEQFRQEFKTLYDNFINGTNVDVGGDLKKVFDDDVEIKEIIDESRKIQMENYNRYRKEMQKTTSSALNNGV